MFEAVTQNDQISEELIQAQPTRLSPLAPRQ